MPTGAATMLTERGDGAGRASQSSSSTVASAADCARTAEKMAAGAMSADEMGKALFDAAKDGSKDEVTRLLEGGAPVNWKYCDRVSDALAGRLRTRGGAIRAMRLGGLEVGGHRACWGGRLVVVLSLGARAESCSQGLDWHKHGARAFSWRVDGSQWVCTSPRRVDGHPSRQGWCGGRDSETRH